MCIYDRMEHIIAQFGDLPLAACFSHTLRLFFLRCLSRTGVPYLTCSALRSWVERCILFFLQNRREVEILCIFALLLCFSPDFSGWSKQWTEKRKRNDSSNQRCKERQDKSQPHRNTKLLFFINNMYVCTAWYPKSHAQGVTIWKHIKHDAHTRISIGLLKHEYMKWNTTVSAKLQLITISRWQILQAQPQGR